MVQQAEAPPATTELEITPTDPAAPAEESAPPASEQAAEPSAELPSTTEDFLKEQGLVDNAPASGDGDGTPAPDAPASWLDKLDGPDREAAEAEIEAARTLKQQEQTRRTEGRKVAFNGRKAAIEEHFKPVVAGARPMTQDDLNKLINTFNAHHSDAHFFEAESFTEGLLETAEKFIPEKERAAFKAKPPETYDALFKDIQKRARDGFVPEKDVNKKVVAGINKHVEWLTDPEHPERLTALTAKHRAPAVSANGASATGKAFANVDALSAAFYNKEIDSAVYEREHVRLTGKKPGEY